MKNYQKLMNDWFSRSLLEYNFYILPLGFAYNFETLSLLEVEKKPEPISKLITAISQTQSELTESNGFHFVCEIITQIVAPTKKLTEYPDIITQINPDHLAGVPAIIKTQRLIDKYPLSHKQIWQKVKAKKPHIKQHQLYEFIKKYNMKENRQFSDYNFKTREHRERYEKMGILPKDITVIYNEDAVRFIIENIEEG